MAQFEDSRELSSSSTGEMNTWAIGLIFLGSLMMMLLGSLHLVIGLSALIQDEFFQVRPGFGLEMDVTAWGWLQIVFGFVMMGTGFWIWTSSPTARLIGIGLIALAAIWNFYSIPYYPLWSIVTLAMCLAILWALIVHGHEFQDVISDENSLTS